MNEQKVEDTEKLYAEALKRFDQEISELKKSNTDLEEKLKKHLSDYQADMLSLVALGTTLEQFLSSRTIEIALPESQEAVACFRSRLSALKTQFGFQAEAGK